MAKYIVDLPNLWLMTSFSVEYTTSPARCHTGPVGHAFLTLE